MKNSIFFKAFILICCCIPIFASINIEDDAPVTKKDWIERAEKIRKEKGKELLLPTNMNNNPFESVLDIKDEHSILQLGMLIATMPGLSGGTCVGSCHSANHSFAAAELRPAGKRGLFDILYNACYPNTIKPDHPKDTRSGSMLNIAMHSNLLTDGALGRYGMNQNVSRNDLVGFNNINAYDLPPTILQFLAGSELHEVEDLLALVRQDTNLVNLASKGYGTNQLNKLSIANALAFWESSIVSNQTNTQKYLRGEIVVEDLHNPKGFVLFYDTYGCDDCHSGGAMGGTMRSEGLVESSNVGFFRVTKDSSDYKMFKVPDLNNIKDRVGLLHSQIKTTPYRVMGMHDISMTASDKRAIQSWLRNDCQDDEAVKKALSYR